MTIRKILLYGMLATVASPVTLWGKTSLEKYHDEIIDLSVDDNLQSPQVPSKLLTGAQTAMFSLSTRLSRAGYATDLSERDGLVLMVTVPAADIFNPSDTVVSPTAPQKLKPLANLLRVPDRYKMLIAVHSDDTGSEEYLNNLTRARADAIRQWIAGEGIPVDGVVPYGLGFDEPLNNDVSRKGRAANRRVEFYFVPGPVMIDELKAGRR